jgi:3-oxoacyl-(acyl-carrier-protein) synthase
MGLEAATKALLDAGWIVSLSPECQHDQANRVQVSHTTLSKQLMLGTVLETLPLARCLLFYKVARASLNIDQRALYNLGLTGIPIVNVNNNCSTGSTAFYQSNNLVKYGAAECVMALGFERMAPGSLAR